MTNAERELYPILATAAPCIYLSLAITNKELYILEPYPWFHPAPKTMFGLVETRVHAALAMPATLAALGAIFQAFPAPCPCGPRLPRGEMQAVPCGARSNTRLLPASTSQASPADIRSVRKYDTGICLFVQVNAPYIRTRLVTPQEKNKHTGSTTPTDAFAPASTSGRPRSGRTQAGLPLSAPMPRTHVEIRDRNGPGRRAPKLLTNPIHMCTAATSAVCCCYCCCCAAADGNLVRAVAATAAVLLLRLVE